MCQARLTTYNTSVIRPLNAQKLVCVKTGQAMTISSKYGMFCDKLCGFKEAQTMFNLFNTWSPFLLAAYAGIEVPNNKFRSDNSGCEVGNEKDNPRDPKHIKQHYMQGEPYIVR